jgi:hypothetical protein
MRDQVLANSEKNCAFQVLIIVAQFDQDLDSSGKTRFLRNEYFPINSRFLTKRHVKNLKNAAAGSAK